VRRFCLFEWDDVVLEEQICAVLIDLTCRDIKNKSHDLRLFGNDFKSVDKKEGVGGKKSGPFVTVGKGMVARYTVKISGGEFQRFLFSIGSFVQWTRQSCLECVFILKARQATMFG